MAFALAGVEARARRTSHHPGLLWAARLGLVSKGVVYLLVGYLAFEAARGHGHAGDTKGAMHEVGRIDHVLLIPLAVGLIAYGLWRIVQAVADVDHHGRDWKA